MAAKEDKPMKTVKQYSKKLSKEVISRFIEIAEDFGKVKGYVHKRFSGIKSINMLGTGYDVIAAMRKSGLRQSLNYPSTYFDCAVLDAARDIKSVWAVLRLNLRSLIENDDNLSVDEKRYIYYIFNYDSLYYSVLNRKPINSLNPIFRKLDINRLNNLIRRLTRKYKPNIGANFKNCRTFKAAPNGYKYEDNGIYLASRQKRKRIFVPLRDSRTFSGKVITFFVNDDYIELRVPVEMKVKYRKNYVNVVFVSIGYGDMFTLSNSNVYGRSLNDYISSVLCDISVKRSERGKIIGVAAKKKNSGDIKAADKISANNLGTKKFHRKKRKNKARITGFINAEINRMLKNEKPCKIVTLKKPPQNLTNLNKRTRIGFIGGYDSYIREKLKSKCVQNDISIEEIGVKGVGKFCCVCGKEGSRSGICFKCNFCETRIPYMLNSAKNIEKAFRMYHGEE